MLSSDFVLLQPLPASFSGKVCNAGDVAAGTGEAFHVACPDRVEPRAHHNDGNRLSCILGRLDCHVPCRYHDDINLETHQLGRKLRVPIGLPLRISVLDGDVLSFYVATLAASRIASERADSLAGSDDDRYPIRGTFFGCCASAE